MIPRKKNNLYPDMFGYRQDRSSVDGVIYLLTSVQLLEIRWRFSGAVFLDIKGAFDPSLMLLCKQILAVASLPRSRAILNIGFYIYERNLGTQVSIKFMRVYLRVRH